MPAVPFTKGRTLLEENAMTEPDVSRERWVRAVLERNKAYDGVFVYAVTTTGVYCRPHCPSRKPRRENIRFFTGGEPAQKAGFRPCLRCRPDDGPFTEGTSPKVVAACRYIEACADRIPPLEEVAGKVGLSPGYLQRTFTGLLGVSPRQYAQACRSARFRKALRAGESIASALYGAGYGSTSRVYGDSGGAPGMTPRTYREKGSGETIFSTVVRCALGFLLVAATPKGVCAVKIGDAKADLEEELRREFPNATIREKDAQLEAWTRHLVSYLDGEVPWPLLPYDIKATAFQKKVWEMLRAIPEGCTVHYGEMAASLGNERGARAVARACATNPAALVIPCHRVVPLSGGSGGYRWGRSRKERLLEMEQKRTCSPEGLPEEKPGRKKR